MNDPFAGHCVNLRTRSETLGKRKTDYSLIF